MGDGEKSDFNRTCTFFFLNTWFFPLVGWNDFSLFFFDLPGGVENWEVWSPPV